MATKSTAKKQPFVIEPLNWVAPSQSNEDTEKKEESKKAAQAEELQD
ncbi:hypothetical protein [Allopusillimonas ginsengisoli]|nr:hypothetical protein [Allopusillimonas ginsengisoli]